MSNPSSSGWDSSSNLTQFGIGLANTVQSDVASHLPLPSLPIFCGSTQPGEFKLFDEAGEGISDNRSLNRSEILSQSRRIANMLEETDVSYLDLRNEARALNCNLCDDESSIQDLVCKTFYEFWFEEPPGHHTQFASDASSIPVEVETKTKQMVEELSRGEGDVQVLPYVLALHAFCLVDPGLCTPASDPTKFVITLQPYPEKKSCVKGVSVDSRIGAQLLESIIFIIDSVLPLIRKLPFSVTEDLEQDLKHMIVRHSFLTVVHACVRLERTAVASVGVNTHVITV
ncbi:hypothetical protein HID58_089038 [Brassica napus]|uniref:Rab3 GTPase-activating protein catalytic subunit n=3 Tax=Brassica TaxID=3705 RepID=A0ABQ7XXV8_BRANA|nr:hypothetical protein HID58_089038 [Brassica napus]